MEFPVDEEFIKQHEAGKILDSALLEGVQLVDVIGYAKGK